VIDCLGPVEAHAREMSDCKFMVLVTHATAAEESCRTFAVSSFIFRCTRNVPVSARFRRYKEKLTHCSADWLQRSTLSIQANWSD